MAFTLLTAQSDAIDSGHSIEVTIERVNDSTNGLSSEVRIEHNAAKDLAGKYITLPVVLVDAFINALAAAALEAERTGVLPRPEPEAT